MRSGIREMAATSLLVVVAFVSWAQESKPVRAKKEDGRVPAGEYVEIDTEGRANRDFLLLVQEISPNIIHLRGKNGWVAFASFDPGKKDYRGFFEWPELPGVGRPGGKWADLYQIRVVVLDGVLRIEGNSAKNEMLIRAKSSGDRPIHQPTPAPRAPEVKR